MIELDARVWNHARFRAANPDHDILKACLYIGSTGLSPTARYAKHKCGEQANRFVQDYGLRLRPDLYECYNPMPYHAALDMEIELAIALRAEGYAVWQG